MKKPSLVIFVLTLSLPSIFSANILAFICTPALSHHAPFQPLWRELSLRGHKVTVLTTHPIGDASLTNLTEINLNSSIEVVKSWKIFEKFIEGMDIKTTLRVVEEFMTDTTTAQFQIEEVQKLLESDQQFDLILAEVHFPAVLGFVWKFKCPWIGLSSLDSPMQYHHVMGNPVHPIYNPDFNYKVEHTDGLTFIERLLSLVFNCVYETFFANYLDNLSVSQKKFFGKDMPHLREIQNNISMFFITTNPLTHDLRALQPNTISIGTGLQIKKPQKLPKDIQDFMDEAPNGVIFFSLGSNVMNTMVTRKFFETMVAGLAEVPYQVLFKTDSELKYVPKNFKVSTWMPQQDILRHPNLKLFITHGGLQSLQETIYNGVPVLVFPLFGDGFANANKAARMGYGLKLDFTSVTKQTVIKSVEEVIRDPKYKEKITEAMNIYKDVEIPGLQRAVYWTEYVIRHKGARHLRNPVLDEPLWKYYMLDVFGSIALILVVSLYLLYRILKICYHFIFMKPTVRKIHSE